MASTCSAFDQAIIDASLNNRAHVPDHLAYFQRWSQASEQARADIGGQWDLAYGPSARQVLDYFPAAQDGPLLVFIHGGYWQSMDHKFFGFLARPFVAAGINFAAVTHDLCPDVSIAEIGRQARAAIAFLHANARRLGFDARRIFVSGHSAGGQLTALMAQTDWARHGLGADAIKGGISISGLYDLEPIRRSYLNANLRMDAAMARAESPLHHIPARAPPLLLICGAAELIEYPRQQRQFAEAWSGAGLAARSLELEGAHHFSVLDQWIAQDGPAWAASKTLMGV